MSSNHSAQGQEDLGRLYKRPVSNGRLSSDYNMRARSLLRTSQEDFSDEANTGSRNGSAATLKQEDMEHLNQRTSSLHIPEVVPIVISKPRSTDKTPMSPTTEYSAGTAYSHITARIVNTASDAINAPVFKPRQVGGSIPRPREPLTEEWDSQGATLARGVKEKPSFESIDLNEIQGMTKQQPHLTSRHSYVV